MCCLVTFDYHNKPVKRKNPWTSKKFNMTGRYKGKRNAGEIWQDKDGFYHSVFLAQGGEDAAIKGLEIIEE